MKIRTNFVSNSSSSSYIIITTEEIHKKILVNKVTDKTYNFFVNKVKPEIKKLGNANIVTIYAYLSTEGQCCQVGNYRNNDIMEDEYNNISDKFYEYLEQIQKYPNEVIIREIE